MVITDHFVYIHIGKTGGTFVEKVLDRLSGANRVYFNTANPRDRAAFGSVNQHETAGEIPECYRDRKLLFSVRSPYDHYVSHFEFGAWKEEGKQLDIERTSRKYPRFPDLTFAEFLEAINDWDLRVPPRGARPRPWEPGLFAANDLGFLSWNQIRFCFADPIGVVGDLSDVGNGGWRALLVGAHFLRTHRLNQDLYAFLLTAGYERRTLDFILQLDKIRPDGPPPETRPAWQSYFTEDQVEFVQRKERFLFAMFPEFRARRP